MNRDETITVLRERRNWLTARIAAKNSVGWDVEWDTRERDALSAALDLLDNPPAGPQALAA